MAGHAHVQLNFASLDEQQIVKRRPLLKKSLTGGVLAAFGPLRQTRKRLFGAPGKTGELREQPSHLLVRHKTCSFHPRVCFWIEKSL
jgi:hypothetical protein